MQSLKSNITAPDNSSFSATRGTIPTALFSLFSPVFLFITNTTKNIVAKANSTPPKKKGKPSCTLSKTVPINGAITLIRAATLDLYLISPLVYLHEFFVT